MGGAAGDALGYPVEFLRADNIRERCGERGITTYELTDGVAQFSDDTQMTLFTMGGLLNGRMRAMAQRIEGGCTRQIAYAYKDWLYTQFGSFPMDSAHRHTWLVSSRSSTPDRPRGIPARRRSGGFPTVIAAPWHVRSMTAKATLPHARGAHRALRAP